MPTIFWVYFSIVMLVTFPWWGVEIWRRLYDLYHWASRQRLISLLDVFTQFERLVTWLSARTVRAITWGRAYRHTGKHRARDKNGADELWADTLQGINREHILNEKARA